MKMADFINFEVDVEGNSDHDDEVSNISDSDSLKSFIDNKEFNADVNFYRHFNNIETEYNNALYDVENFEEISNLC